MQAPQPDGASFRNAVLVVADLHLDLWKRTDRDPLEALPPQVWENLAGLIVAGDLSNDAPRKWPRHLARLTARMEPARIHILPGNHDYYGLPLGADDRLAEICAAAGVNLAQKSRIKIGARRFLCATLWTDFTLPGEVADHADFRRISAPGCTGPLTPAQVTALHRDHRAWLSAQLEEPWSGETVVVTHHAPLPAALTEGHLPAAFASDLRPMIAAARPARWLFGHTHHRIRLDCAGTAVQNVSFGTPSEVPPGTERAALLSGLLT